MGVQLCLRTRGFAPSRGVSAQVGVDPDSGDYCGHDVNFSEPCVSFTVTSQVQAHLLRGSEVPTDPGTRLVSPLPLPWVSPLLPVVVCSICLGNPYVLLMSCCSRLSLGPS